MSDKTDREKFHREIAADEWGQKMYVDRYRFGQSGQPWSTIWVSIESDLGDEATLELSLDEASALERALRDAREFR